MDGRRGPGPQLWLLISASAAIAIPGILKLHILFSVSELQDPMIAGALATLVFTVIGLSIFLIKFWELNRRQNKAPLDVQRSVIAGTGIRKSVAKRIIQSSGISFGEIKRPLLLWSRSGPFIYDLDSGQRTQIPISTIRPHGFAPFSAQADLLGYFRYSIGSDFFKSTIWVYDGCGTSWPLQTQRKEEFLRTFSPET